MDLKTQQLCETDAASYIHSSPAEMSEEERKKITSSYREWNPKTNSLSWATL